MLLIPCYLGHNPHIPQTQSGEFIMQITSLKEGERQTPKCNMEASFNPAQSKPQMSLMKTLIETPIFVITELSSVFCGHCAASCRHSAIPDRCLILKATESQTELMTEYSFMIKLWPSN